jgi:transcription antitermination factor NusG
MWCVLRMSGQRTQAVTDSLTAAGFEVWTPLCEESRRRPRSKVRVRRIVPVMPTYVFARATHLHDLLAEASNPTTDHPPFSVFRWDGRIPLIADRHLNALRVAEQKRKTGKAAPSFAAGEIVRVIDGPAAGLSGIVERSKGKFALVAFPDSQVPMDISTFLLVPDAAHRAA